VVIGGIIMLVRELRVAPLSDAELDDEQRSLLDKLGAGRALNIFRTLLRHPGLYRRWMRFGDHVLSKSTLGARERELLILRIGCLCASAYEVHQHTRIGKQVGLSDEEIARIRVGPEAVGWDEFDRTLLRAVDELHADSCIGAATWAALAARYNTQQLIDVIMTVGQYTMVSMALNSLGVQIEQA
jgi:4-carboxymuconolactone decarboxylase